MTGSEFAYLRHRAGFDQRHLAQYLGVSLRTVRRYEKCGAPRMAVLAVALRAGEYPDWEGFWFRDGKLTNPVGQTMSRAELEDWHYQFYLAWWRGWEAHRVQSARPGTSETQPRRLYVIQGGVAHER